MERSTHGRSARRITPTEAAGLVKSGHFSAYDRMQYDAGHCHYIPCNLG